MKKIFLGILCVLGIITVTVTGFSLSFFTHTDSVTNVLEVGKVSIKIEEPNWTENLDKGIEPGKILSKDPFITNIGENKAYVYIEVKIPRAELVTVSSAGAKQAAKKQDLFAMLNISLNWTLLSHSEDADFSYYIYGYNEELNPNDKTDSLFDSIEFLDVIEGQGISANTYIVNVKAMAIQAEETESMQEAYNKYITQNDDE